MHCESQTVLCVSLSAHRECAIFNELFFRLSTSSTCWAVHVGFSILSTTICYKFEVAIISIFQRPSFQRFIILIQFYFFWDWQLGTGRSQKCPFGRPSYSVDTIIIIHKPIENFTIILSIINSSLSILLKFLYFNFFNELFGT